MANCGILNMLACGNVKFHVHFHNGGTRTVVMHDCMHAPDVPINLISVGYLQEQLFHILFHLTGTDKYLFFCKTWSISSCCRSNIITLPLFSEHRDCSLSGSGCPWYPLISTSHIPHLPCYPITLFHPFSWVTGAVVLPSWPSWHGQYQAHHHKGFYWWYQFYWPYFPHSLCIVHSGEATATFLPISSYSSQSVWWTSPHGFHWSFSYSLSMWRSLFPEHLWLSFTLGFCFSTH